MTGMADEARHRAVEPVADRAPATLQRRIEAIGDVEDGRGGDDAAGLSRTVIASNRKPGGGALSTAR